MFTFIPKTKDYRERLTKHPAKSYALRSLDSITHLAVHHSLTTEGSAEAFARYHVKSHGWPGIGYHFVIEKDGTIKWCNPLEVKSYHVGNSNRFSVGICLVGDFRKQELQPIQLDPLLYLLKYLSRELSIPPANIKGHNEFPDYSLKECPCINMEAIRTAVDPHFTKKEVPVVPAFDFISASEIFLNPNLLVTKPGETVISAINRLHNIDPGDVKSSNKTVNLHKRQSEPLVVKTQGPVEQLPAEVDHLIRAVEKEGHLVFKSDTKPYNLNIIGIRSRNRIPNAFDDEICVFWKYDNRWTIRRFKVTTDPGLAYLLDPLNRSGTAILKEGQYRGAYRFGLHRNTYTALVQSRPVTVIRDFNRDKVLDINSGREQTGFFGINIHRASGSGESTFVNKWSAGCQVFANINHFNEFMKLCRLATSYWGDHLTYTLIKSDA